ncbi:MAG: hypothetical protein OEW08_13640, partial [Gammaproteobacteria bacterium]|nr:hypothetical protein [Gammaproteobacteria bacterium]
NHVNTTEECSVCHTTTAWRPTLAGGGSGAINGTWGEPINVVTVSAKSNAITLVQGPELAWGENGTGFVSLRKNTGFNYVTGKFAVGEDIVQRFDSATQAWTVKSPVPAAQSKAADFAQIKAYGTQGKAYALWAYGADLHFNTFSGSTWSTPEQMGASSPENYHLLVTPSGAAVVVWVEGGDLVAKRYTPASGNTPASWTSAQTLTVADPYFMPPSVAMDAEGNVAVAWLHQASATGVEHWKTHMASNSVVDNTWSAIQAGQDVPVGTTPLNLHLVMHGAPGLPLMVVQVSSNVLVKGGELFASASHADGSWGMWENLDYNVNMPDKLVGHASVSYNNAGDVVVLWTEREVMNTEVQFHVFANYYASEIAPSKTVNTWEPPTHVSMAVEAASMSAMEETEPSMRLDDTGHLIVVWLATDGVNSKVLSNHYHKTAPAGSNPGWNGSPELIVNYDVATSGYALSPQVGVSPGGKDIAVWKQVVRQQFGIDYKVWSSVVP